MLNRIIQFSIQNKLVVGLMTLALILVGIYNVLRLPIDAVPDITDNQVQIITTSPSLGAPDIERFITVPIEQACNNIQGIKQMRSFSRFGLSVITIVFHDDIPLLTARQQISERLVQVSKDIPTAMGSPSMAPITTGLGEIYQYCLRPRKGYEHRYNPKKLRELQDWIVRKHLLGVEGVADVASFGGELKQYEIALDPARLQALNITVAQVAQALKNSNQNTGGAYIEKSSTVQFIRTEGLAGSLEDLENIAVKRLDTGASILVKDLATVSYGKAVRYGAMLYNGQYEVAGGVVMMLQGANSSQVIKNVKTKVEDIQKMLPAGVKLDPFLDRTKMVNNSISTVTKNLAEGAIIVVLVLVLFLGNLRAGLLVTSVIPLAMLFAITMMNLFGVSGNLMSLGALDFGLIIDGAVIIVEAVLHRLHTFKNKNNVLDAGQMDATVTESAGKMMNSAVFGQVIILMVYLPILSLEGIEGKMFRPMAQTVAFALAGAFILSLTYVPMMSTLVLSKKLSHQANFSDRMILKLQGYYHTTLTWAMAQYRLLIPAVVVAFVLSVYLLTTLGGTFIPTLPEGDFAVDTRVLPCSNLNVSLKAVAKAQRVLLAKFPEIEKIVSKTGSSEIPTDPMPMEASDMMVILKPRETWTSAHDYDTLSTLMSEELARHCLGVSFSFQYPVAMRFNELMTGARQDIVCKIFGEDIDSLGKYAQRLGAISKTIPGASNIFVEPITGAEQLVVRYDYAALARYGVSVAELNELVNTAFAGQVVGSMYEGERKFDLVVRLDADKRTQIQDLQSLQVTTSSGAVLALNQLAEVSLQQSVNQIQRENAQRRIIVGFNVRGADIQTTVEQLQKKVATELQLPTGYTVHYGGTFENLQKAKTRLSIAVPISLVMILLLLYFSFHSVRYSLLIFTAIPLSAIGGILALWGRDMPFSISAGVGFIALFGIAVLNGIVLVAEFNTLRDKGLSILQAVLQGSNTRLRPVLMTAVVASFGFFPMALSTGEGAEVQRPLATVVIGGLLLATFLTLYLLPMAYVLLEEWLDRRQAQRATTL